MSTRDPHRCPTHPGELLREDVMPALGRSAAEVALDLGLSTPDLEALLAERRPVDPELADRLAASFGGSAPSWLRMQDAHDAWKAARSRGV